MAAQLACLKAETKACATVELTVELKELAMVEQWVVWTVSQTVDNLVVDWDES